MGKNIKFTPKKNKIKKINIKISSYKTLNNNSHHRLKPVKIPKTAPILKT